MNATQNEFNDSINLVVYRGRIYKTHLPVRESLFYELRETNPTLQIRIEAYGFVGYVYIRELELWSIYRHL